MQVVSSSASPSTSSSAPKKVRACARAELSRAFEHEWLGWLHQLFPQCSRVVLFEWCQQQQALIVASSCSLSRAPQPVLALVEQCYKQSSAIYQAHTSNAANSLFGIPLSHPDIDYIIVFSGDMASAQAQQGAVQLCRWAGLWLQRKHNFVDSKPLSAMQKNTQAAASSGSSSPASSTLNEPTTIDLTAIVLHSLSQHNDLTASAFALVNQLAKNTQCTRVSLGSCSYKGFKLLAISGQAQFDRRRTAVKQLSAVIKASAEYERLHVPNKPQGDARSTCEQRSAALGDQTQSPFVEHRLFQEQQGGHALYSYRLGEDSKDCFVVLLERRAGKPFMPLQTQAIEQALQEVASVFYLLREQQRGVRARLHQQLHVQLRRYVKHGFSTKQTCLLALFGGLILSLLIQVNHTVSAEAYIEAADLQVIVAPHDSFVMSAHARAGQSVKRGDLLATLDDHELSLSENKWLSEHKKNQQQYAQALAGHNRADLSRLRAESKGIEAELALVQQQLSRIELRAPFDGIVLDGDLSQSLGAPVKAGDVLFEMGSAEQYRLVLEVDEHDVGLMGMGQPVLLRMASMPNTQWQAHTNQVMPVAVSEQGQSVFRVPATMKGDAQALRAGMQGVARVTVGRGALLTVYAQKMLDRLRYLLWKFGFY